MCQCTQNRRAEILNPFQPVTTGSNTVPTDQTATSTTSAPAANMDLIRAAITYRSPRERLLSTLQILATVLAIVISIRILLIQKQ